MKYYIENMGCHDTTEAMIEMAEEEAKIFIRICNELNNNSNYGCQPIIAMYKEEDCEIKKYEDGQVSIYPDWEKNLLRGEEDE